MIKIKVLKKMLAVFLVSIMVATSFCTAFAAVVSGNQVTISGKIADWSFDEGTGTTVTDSVNAIEGTVSGGNWTTGKLGNAIQFSAAGANARIGTTNEAFNNLNTLTMGMWVYPDSSSTNDTSILLSSDWSWDWVTSNSTHALQWAINWDKSNYANSTMSVGVIGSSSTADPYYGGTNSIALGDIRDSWHYVAFSYDVNTKTVKYYLDGSLLNEATYGETGIAVSVDLRNFQIGEWNWDSPPTRSFKGNLDELKIFNSALSAEEIAQLYNQGSEPTVTPTPDPTGNPGGEILFPFNEGNGTTSNSVSGSLTATLNNYVWDTNNGRAGTPAISNSETGQGGLEINYGDQFASVNDLTMGVWVKPAGPSSANENESTLMAPPYAGTTGNWGFNNGEIWWKIIWGTSANNYSDTKISFLSYGSNGSEWDGGFDATAGNLADGNWHYLSFSYSSTDLTVKLYLDGTMIGEKSYTSLAPVNLQAYKWFGGNGYQGRAYTGLLDELSVFPSVLDDAGHAALYNRAPNTSGVVGGTTTLPEGYVARWNLNKITDGKVTDSVSEVNDIINNATEVTGNHAGAVSFTGGGDSNFTVSRDVTGGAGFANGMSVSMWVNMNDLANGGFFTTQTDMGWYWGGNELTLQAEADGSISAAASAGLWGPLGLTPDEGCTNPDGGWSWKTAPGVLNTGAWHHITLTYDNAGHMVLYVDGVKAGGATYNNIPVLAPNKLYFGMGYQNAPAVNFDGLMDEIVVYNRALTANEVSDVYNYIPDDGVEAPPVIGDKVYYVSKESGSDTNDGLSSGTAFKTIQKAADIALPGETVIISAGVYEESVRPHYNGVEGYPITFRAADGEKVVISGADKITGAWQTASNPNAVEYNADDANLWKVNASLPMGNYRNQIFVDGESMMNARYPNVAKEDAYYRPNWLTYVFDGANGSVGGWNTVTGKLSDPELNQPAGTWNGAAIVGMDNRGWNLTGAEVVSSTPGWLDLTNVNFYELGPTGYASGSDFPYYIQNAMAAMDAPYEWFYDQTSETLYLQLPNGMDPNNLDVRYKAREWGLDLSSRKFIHIQGIDLNGCNLTMRNGENNIVDKMTAKYVTSYLSPSNERGGIIVGGKNNILINSEIAYSSGALVTIEGEGNKVVNNKLHDATTGPSFFTFSITISGVNHLISHNEVYNASSTLIGGNYYACEISYNDIHDGNWHSSDCGLMYSAYTDLGNSQIHHNYIHDSHSEFSNGVYFDLGCKNAQVYENVFWNLPWAAVFTNSSSEFISVFNNTVYQGAYKHPNPEIYANSPGDAYMDIYANNLVDSRGVGSDNTNAGQVVINNYSRPEDDIDGTATFTNPSASDFTLKSGSGAIGYGMEIEGIGTTSNAGAYQPGDSWKAGLMDTSVTVEEANAGPQLLPFAHKNLLLNSGFEWQRLGYDSIGTLPYWKKAGTGTVSIVQASSSADKAHAREQYAISLIGENIGLEQTINGLEPGKDYVLRGFARVGSGSSAEGQNVEIGVRVGSDTFKSDLNRPAWRSASIKFTADETGTATIYATKTTAGSEALIDDFSVVRSDLVPNQGPVSDDLYPMFKSPVILLDDMLFKDSKWTVTDEASFVKDEPTGLTLEAQPGKTAAAFYTQDDKEKYRDKDFYLKLGENENLDALDLTIILRANAATRDANRYEIDIQGTTATLTRYYSGTATELGQWPVDINDRLLKAGAVWEDNGSGYGVVTVTLKSGNDTLFTCMDENNLNVSTAGYFGLATETSINLGRVTEYVDMTSVIADKSNWKSNNSVSWQNNDTTLTPDGSASAGYMGRTFGDAEFVVGFQSGLNTGAFPCFLLRAPTEDDILNNPWSGTKYSIIIKEDTFEIQHWPEAWNPGSGSLSTDLRSALADNKGFVPPYRDTLVKVSTVNTDYGVWIRLKVGDTIVASWIDESNYITNEGYFGICGYTEPMSISVPNESTYAPVIGDPDAKPGSVSPTLTNYALNKPVTVSSEYYDQWTGTLISSNAVDGDPETRWAATEGSSYPQWIQVDLGSMVAIEQLRLIWGSDYANSYEILASSDGTNWTPLFSTSSGDGQQDDILLNTAVEAQYVKLNVQGSSNLLFAPSVMEFEVYGTLVPEPVNCTITASAGDNGTISPNGAVEVEQGTAKTFTFTPDSGYDVDKVLVDGLEVEDIGNSYTFTDVTADHTISVSFKAEPTPSPVPTPTPDPNQLVKVQVSTLEVNTEKAEATVTVDKAALDKALEGSAGALIEIPKIAGVDSYVTTLPSTALTSDNSDQKIEIVTDAGSVTVPANMLDKAEVTGSQNISIIIAKADTSGFNTKLKNEIGNRPVVELYMMVDGVIKPWNNPDNVATISVDYKPTAEELKHPEHIVIWYIDGTGKTIAVPNSKYDINTGKVVFTTTHFSQYAVAYVNKTFNDLESYSWAKNQIEVMASKGVINGTSETTYNPSASITRADFILLLVKALGLSAKVDSNFSDVSSTAYYAEAVGIAKKLNITTGVGENRFAPETFITRQDMMALIYRAMVAANKSMTEGTNADLDKFADKLKVAGYAVQSVETLIRNGIVAGDGVNINPLGNASRAETAVLIYRIYNK